MLVVLVPSGGQFEILREPDMETKLSLGIRLKLENREDAALGPSLYRSLICFWIFYMRSFFSI